MHAAYCPDGNAIAGRRRRPYGRTVRCVVLTAAVLVVACGGGSRREPFPTLANGDTGSGAPKPRVAGPPDAGTRAGHGGDPAAEFAQSVHGVVRVPAHDRTPPLALLRLVGGAGKPVVHDSPVRAGGDRPVRLLRPQIVATALIRDTDGGTGRIRVSVVYVTRCGGVQRQHGEYFPPPQVEAVKIAPGVRMPVQQRRTARVSFPPDCGVIGKAFAEATNASGLESFSDPIWFQYDPASPNR